jgi:hypothetical protein
MVISSISANTLYSRTSRLLGMSVGIRDTGQYEYLVTQGNRCLAYASMLTGGNTLVTLLEALSSTEVTPA